MACYIVSNIAAFIPWCENKQRSKYLKWMGHRDGWALSRTFTENQMSKWSESHPESLPGKTSVWPVENGVNFQRGLKRIRFVLPPMSSNCQPKTQAVTRLIANLRPIPWWRCEWIDGYWYGNYRCILIGYIAGNKSIILFTEQPFHGFLEPRIIFWYGCSCCRKSVQPLWLNTTQRPRAKYHQLYVEPEAWVTNNFWDFVWMPCVKKTMTICDNATSSHELLSWRFVGIPTFWVSMKVMTCQHQFELMQLDDKFVSSSCLLLYHIWIWLSFKPFDHVQISTPPASSTNSASKHNLTPHLATAIFGDTLNVYHYTANMQWTCRERRETVYETIYHKLFSFGLNCW